MKKPLSFSIVGGSSLLVIFAVLCLTVFALLSIGTVQTASKLSQHSADAVNAYYNADKEAERILSQLRSGIIPEEVSCNNGIYSYICPISDTLELHVKIKLNTPNNYTILQWQSVSISQWKIDDNIDLWDGNE